MTAARRSLRNITSAPGPFEGLVQYSSADADQFNKLKVDSDGSIFAVGTSGNNAMIAKLDSGLNITNSLFMTGDTTSNEGHAIDINGDVYAACKIQNTGRPRGIIFRLSKSDLSVVATGYHDRSSTSIVSLKVRDNGEIDLYEGQITSSVYTKWNSTLSSLTQAWRPWAGSTQESFNSVIDLSATESVVTGGLPTAIPRLCKFNTDTGALIVDSRSYYGSGRGVNQWNAIAKDATHVFVVGESDGTGGTMFAQVYKYDYSIVNTWDLAYTGASGANSFAGVLKNGNGLYCVGYTTDFTGTNRGALVVKINPDTPAFVAEKVFHNTYDCEFFGVDDDADGNIYVCGYLGTGTNPKAVVMKLNKDLDYTSISPGCASGLVVTNTSSSLADSSASINNQSLSLGSETVDQQTATYTTQSPTMTTEGPCAFN